MGILFKHWEGEFKQQPLCAMSHRTHLADDAKRLAELLDTAQITVVAVTVLTDGDVELNLELKL